MAKCVATLSSVDGLIQGSVTFEQVSREAVTFGWLVLPSSWGHADRVCA